MSMKRFGISLAIIGLLWVVYLYPQSVLTSNDTVLSGQQNATAVATNLGTTAVKTVCVVAAHGNASPVYLGGSNVTTSNGLIVNADQSWCINVKNLGAVYVVSSGSGSISWGATK